MPAAEGYLLYPYLRYEDLRHRRAAVPAPEMADFLAAHRDWAFADGLETVWLRTLGKRGRWQAVQDGEVHIDVAVIAAPIHAGEKKKAEDLEAANQRWRGARCRTGRDPLQSVQQSRSPSPARPTGEMLATPLGVAPLVKVPNLYGETRLDRNSEQFTEPLKL